MARGPWENNKFGLATIGSYCAPSMGHPAPGAYNSRPATRNSGMQRGQAGQKPKPLSEDERKGSAKQDEKNNALRFTNEDPEEVVGYLVKGAEVGNAKGDYAKNCEDQEGYIKGYGPECEPLEEEGESATAECFYRETLICITDHRFRIREATQKFIDAMWANQQVARTQYNCGFGTVGGTIFCEGGVVISAAHYVQEDLEPHRDDYAFSEMQFKECVDNVPNECECKRCLWDINIGEDEPEDDQADEAPTTPPEVPDEPTITRKFKAISTTASTGPIPRVWGRYVVGGNIIQLGAPQTVLREVIEESKSGGSKTTNVFDTYVDFHVGLCRGRINSLLRVWFDDMLILNEIVDPNDPAQAITDLDLSMLTRSDYDLSTLAARKPVLELYEGQAYQKVTAESAYKEGFGRAPAYRDLAVLHFKDINLALFGGGFPKIRVDIVTEAATETYVFQSDEIAALDLNYLSINPSTGMMYTKTTTNSYNLLDWDSVDIQYSGYAESTSYFYPLSSNHILTLRSGDFATVDPAFTATNGRVTDTSPFGLTLAKNAYDTYMARNIRFLDTRLLLNFDLVVATLNDNRIGYVYYDYANEKLYSNFVGGTTGGVIDDGSLDTGAPVIEAPVEDPGDIVPPEDVDFLPDDAVIPPSDPEFTEGFTDEEGTGTPAEGFIPTGGGGFITPFGYRLPLSVAVYPPSEATVWQNALIYVNNRIYYYQFFLPTGTQNELRIVRFEIVDNGGLLKTVLTSEITTIANTALWGSDTSGVKLCNLYHSAADNTFILFFRCETSNRYFIAKFDPATSALVWRTECFFPITSWNESGDVGSRSTGEQLFFLSTDSDVLHLDLVTGEITDFGPLSGLSAPAYEPLSAQYYDARTNSLAYISSVGGAQRKVVRLMLQRLSPNRVSLGYIVRDIATKSTRTKDIIDASGIDAITVDGYAALDSISVSQFFSNLAEFYQLAVVDTGRVLSFVQKSTLSSPTVIDEVEDVITETERKQKTVDASLPDAVSVSFVTVDEVGLSENYQVVSIREQDDDVYKAPNTREFALTVNEDSATMRRYAEQTLRAVRAAEQKVSVEFMPRMLALTTHDPIEYGGVVYRISTEYLSPFNHSGVTAERFEYDDYDTQVSLGAVDLSSTVSISRNHKVGLMRPNILFCNAVNNEDALRAASGTQIAYSVVEAAEANIPPTNVALRVLPHTRIEMLRIEELRSKTAYDVPASDLYISSPHTKAAHFGILLEPPERDTPTVMRTNDFDEMEVQFARQDTIDYLQTLTNYEESPWLVLEDSTENLLIIGQELIQFGSYEILDDRRVLFWNLYRGVRGTEMYGIHDENDRVYLYSPDTVLPMPVNSEYTKRGAVGRIWIRNARPAGYSAVEYLGYTDAGSARPWAPTHVSAYYVNGDRTRIKIKFKRREPLTFDQLEDGGGTLPSTFGTTDFFITSLRLSQYEDILLDSHFYSRTFLDIPLNARFESLPDDTIVATVELNFPQSSSSVTDLYPTWMLRLIICQYATNREGGLVQGHPLFYDILSGYGPITLGGETDRLGSYPNAP